MEDEVTRKRVSDALCPTRAHSCSLPVLRSSFSTDQQRSSITPIIALLARVRAAISTPAGAKHPRTTAFRCGVRQRGGGVRARRGGDHDDEAGDAAENAACAGVSANIQAQVLRGKVPRFAKSEFGE